MLRVRVDAPRLRDVQGRFARVDAIAEEELNWGVRTATELIYRAAIDNIRETFSGSGRMESSLKMIVNASKRPYGEVFIRGMEYVVHEFGGRKSYRIFPRDAKVLRFSTSTFIGRGTKSILRPTGKVFSRWVDREPLPERSYLRRAYEENRSAVRSIFDEAGRRIAARTASG